VEAAAALAHLAAGRQQRVGEGADLLLRLAQQVQGQTLGGARTDAGQPLELVDQAGQGSGETAQRSIAGTRNLGSPLAQGENGRSSCRPMGPLPVSPRRSVRWSSGLIGLLLALMLVGCSAAAAGLNSFQSPDGRYAFLYPTGWTRVQVSGGPQVVFHDLINSDETLSLVVSEVNEASDLSKLGSAQAVGEKLRRSVIAPEGSGRDAELVEAREREQGGRTHYDLEYRVHLADRDRHELATVVVDRGRLYTFAASTNEVRWPKVKELFERVISSFNLQI
jgi:photosystem II oxygen-evolving enhancer protein 2